MDNVSLALALGLAATLIWVALELRALHESLLPIAALANSPVLQSFAGPA